jgi:hypothetical protein
MRIETHQSKSTSVAMILVAVAVLLGALVLYEVAGFFMTTAHAELAVARAAGGDATEPNSIEERLAKGKSAAEALKKKNLFAPPAPKQNPVREVIGILGDEALINGKWYKAGASVGDAKILAVGPTTVKVSWNGQEKEFSPIGASGSPGGPGGPRPPSGPRGGPPRPGGPPAQEPRPGRADGPPGVSPEERASFAEQMRNASPEERRKLIEEMRERATRSR